MGSLARRQGNKLIFKEKKGLRSESLRCLEAPTFKRDRIKRKKQKTWRNKGRRPQLALRKNIKEKGSINGHTKAKKKLRR